MRVVSPGLVITELQEPRFPHEMPGYCEQGGTVSAGISGNISEQTLSSVRKLQIWEHPDCTTPRMMLPPQPWQQ